jgi:hypothetical protein
LRNGLKDTATTKGHEVQNVTATFRNGRVELAESVDWPEGTRVEIRPLAAPDHWRSRAKPPMTEWPAAFFDQLREEWSGEAFDRPPQGESEVREDW